ncbi:MAG: glutamate-1-semialdehyde 2,1-aminomutase [Candidatus Bathyarchaeia archaeon]
MKKLSRSEELFEKAKRLIPGGVNSPVRAFSPYPFFTAYAKGSRIFDVDGKEYIDYCMGYGPLILGHAPEPVTEAVREQLEKGTLYGTPTEQEIELAELICEAVPCAEMVRLVNTGTEATMSAIRVARGFTGRKKIVKFEGCYHGAHDYVLVKAGSGATTLGVPNSLGVPEETTLNTLVLPYNNVESFEKTIEKEGENIAAVIIEPVIGNAGVILPKKGYLEKIRKLTKEKGIVLIFDEVITGFRLAFGGAQEYYGIVPDMVTLGKVMGGGFPLAAFAGKKEIMEIVAPSGKVYQAGTFSGNPVSVTAGVATLKAIRKRKEIFYRELERKTEMICAAVKDLIEDYSLPLQVNFVASMYQFFFNYEEVYDYQSAKKSDTARFMFYHKELMKQGIFIPPSQFEACFISSAHSEEDVIKSSEVFANSLLYVMKR